MPARRALRQWVLASHNAGKLGELRALFAEPGLRLRTAVELGLPEPPETGETFEANATLKATAAARASGLIALADDSGVEVHALGGEPGIYTAGWAGPGKDFAVARRRVQRQLEARGQGASRRATYVSVLCLAHPGGRASTYRGETRGVLVWPPRGSFGHGFEPMFLPDGYAITYGEMRPERRLQVNARADAARALRGALAASGDTEGRSTGKRSARGGGLDGFGSGE